MRCTTERRSFSAPGTFSIRMCCGSSTSAARTMVRYSSFLSSACRVRLLKSLWPWHGGPPTSTSIVGVVLGQHPLGRREPGADLAGQHLGDVLAHRGGGGEVGGVGVGRDLRRRRPRAPARTNGSARGRPRPARSTALRTPRTGRRPAATTATPHTAVRPCSAARHARPRRRTWAGRRRRGSRPSRWRPCGRRDGSAPARRCRCGCGTARTRRRCSGRRSTARCEGLVINATRPAKGRLLDGGGGSHGQSYSAVPTSPGR